jgi:hypothetical protein
MVLGSGGVVAGVVGAWAVLWALRRVPERPWQVWAPTAAVFAVLLIVLPAWSVFTTAALGVAEWTADRTDMAPLLDLQRTVLRPLRGSALGLAAGGIALLVARRRAPATSTADLHSAETLGLGLLGSLSVAVLAVTVQVARGVSSLATDPSAAGGVLSASRLGLLLAAVTLAAAMALGLFTALRRR